MAKGQHRSTHASGWKYAGTAGRRRAAKAEPAAARRSVKADAVLPLAVPAPTHRPPARPRPITQPQKDRREPERPSRGAHPSMSLHTALTWTVIAISVGIALSMITRQPWALALTAVAVALIFLWRQLR